MKINKFILKIQHFFGFNKSSEHIDDVNVIIDINQYSKDIQDSILFHNSESDETVKHIKSQVLKCFKSNPKLEKRCRNINQVWVTFRQDPKIEGGLMKKLNWVDGVLYYPIVDKKNFERNQKIQSILNQS